MSSPNKSTSPTEQIDPQVPVEPFPASKDEAEFDHTDWRAAVRDRTFDSLIGQWMVINDRKVLIEDVVDGKLRLVYKHGGPPLRVNTNKGAVEPDIEWLRKKHARGQARPMTMPKNQETISAFAELFDPLAVLESNPRATALWHLADRALKDGTPRSEKAVDDWLDLKYGDGHYDHDIDRPSARTLIRKMGEVNEGAKVADLVNPAGRREGATPYPKATDEIIHAAALAYWAVRPRTKQEAFADLKTRIRNANRKLQPGAVKHKLMSRSAFYERIDKLECEDTVREKFGDEEARRRFSCAGEPIKPNYCFEYGYIDATRLDNVIVFDAGDRLPFLKPWVTAIMDAKSGAILSCLVHAGDPRRETTLQALIESLSPSTKEAPPTDWAA
jgi:hypothetical protein